MVSVEFYHRYSWCRHCNDAHEALGGGEKRMRREADSRQKYLQEHGYHVLRRNINDGVLLLAKNGNVSFIVTIKVNK